MDNTSNVEMTNQLSTETYNCCINIVFCILSFSATKEMRTGLFFYVVALHMLVFVTTYHWSASGGGCDLYSANESLSHLPPSLPAHIQQQMIAKNAVESDPGA
jgi:hypothetical protein